MSKYVVIDEAHSRAICNEIGDRLRSVLISDAPLPPKLTSLLARLDELDFEASPSIVPALDVFEPA